MKRKMRKIVASVAALAFTLTSCGRPPKKAENRAPGYYSSTKAYIAWLSFADAANKVAATRLSRRAERGGKRWPGNASNQCRLPNPGSNGWGHTRSSMGAMTF